MGKGEKTTYSSGILRKLGRWEQAEKKFLHRRSISPSVLVHASALVLRIRKKLLRMGVV